MLDVPVLHEKCNTIFSWGDWFTSQSCRTDRCCYIQAYWVKSGGEIYKSNSSSCFGIIQYFFQQKLQLQGSHQFVQMASVHWLQEVSAYKNYFGEPYEVWPRDLYEPFGSYFKYVFIFVSVWCILKLYQNQWADVIHFWLIIKLKTNLWFHAVYIPTILLHVNFSNDVATLQKSESESESDDCQ